MLGIFIGLVIGLIVWQYFLRPVVQPRLAVLGRRLDNWIYADRRTPEQKAADELRIMRAIDLWQRQNLSRIGYLIAVRRRGWRLPK